MYQPLFFMYSQYRAWLESVNSSDSTAVVENNSYEFDLFDINLLENSDDENLDDTDDTDDHMSSGEDFGLSFD